LVELTVEKNVASVTEQRESSLRDDAEVSTANGRIGRSVASSSWVTTATSIAWRRE
jgi:hypothetical protein